MIYEIPHTQYLIHAVTKVPREIFYRKDMSATPPTPPKEEEKVDDEDALPKAVTNLKIKKSTFFTSISTLHLNFFHSTVKSTISKTRSIFNSTGRGWMAHRCIEIRTLKTFNR